MPKTSVAVITDDFNIHKKEKAPKKDSERFFFFFTIAKAAFTPD
jgi:hypothetical protein